MGKYSGYGNEKLLPLARGNDRDAIAELESRGNTLVDGELEKTGLVKEIEQGTGKVRMIPRKIRNGRVVAES